MTPIWLDVLVGALVLAAVALLFVLSFCRAGAEALELEQEDEK